MRFPGSARHDTAQCVRLIVALLAIKFVSCKTGTFPNLFNVAKGKPIFAQPAQSTCSRLFFCRSTPHASSITSCSNAEFCDASCPTRSYMPDYANLFEYALFDRCAFKDFTFPPPNSASTYSVFYSPMEAVNGNCSVSASGSLLTDLEDRPSFFTLAMWISPDFGSSTLNTTSMSKTVLEKVCNTGKESVVVFSLQLNVSAILWRSSNSKYFVYTDSSLFKSGSWVHLAVQVSNVSLSFFVNGTGDDQLPLQAFRLLPENVAQYPLANCSFHLGQSVAKVASSAFSGHMADVRYYETTLDNREINTVFKNNGTTLNPVYIDSECRCPTRYPRIADQHSRLCLTNYPTSIDAEIRVNRRAHPLEYMTDGDTATYWLSKLINKVVVTIDLLDHYQIFYVLLQFYSPLPKKLTIERQSEGSATWKPWQYYADDCQLRYGMPNNGRLPNHDSVNCIQLSRTNSPFSLGNISFSALQLTPAQRPDADTFYDNPVLLDFVSARRIRITFDGHMFDEGGYVNERHLYFGVFELTASGRCDCNGHASACNFSSSDGKYHCNCEGNTAGANCGRCDDLFNAKPYRTTGDCLPCNCNGHSTLCVYNATIDPFPDRFGAGDGGVCVNCGDYTEGRNCETCMEGYYKPEGHVAPTDPCIPCECDMQGTLPDALGNCTKLGGYCQCKENVEGRTCDRCKSGFYGLSAEKDEGCTVCSCLQAGVANNVIDCDQINGLCTCKANVGGRRCDQCKYGYHSLSMDNPLGCDPCQCDPVGASSIYCDQTNGKCPCRNNVIGQKCNKCAPRYYNLTIKGCMECDCDRDGVVIDADVLCDSDTGQCLCRKYVTGFRCDVCMDGYAQFGMDADTGCIECRCANGTKPGQTCDKETGVCACRQNVVGLSCNLCKPAYWNLSSDNPVGCQPCECDLTGANATCDQNNGRCSCLPNRTGMKCNTCAIGFYKAPPPLLGCLPCKCSNLTSSGQCDPETGQCQCRLDRLGVGGQNCDQCLPGFYGYDPAKGACSRCECFWPGVKGGVAAFQPCNSQTGQCICKEFVTGTKCDECKPGYSILKADNPYGCSTAPAQQPPPRFMDSNSSAINLVWPPPLRPNGVIRRYAVIRNGSMVASVVPTSLEASSIFYTDTSLIPLKYYEYRVMAFTDFGNTTSIGAVFSTLSGAPAGNLTLLTDSVEESAVNLRWFFTPSSSMTFVEKQELWFQVYQLNPDNGTEMVTWRGQMANGTRISRLDSYTPYIFRLEACNQRSECLVGNSVNVTTNEAPPEDQPPPRPTALSTNSIHVEWDPPAKPNGVITFYELWVREIDPTAGNTTTPMPSSGNESDSSSEQMTKSADFKRVLVFHPSGMWIRQRSGDATRRNNDLPLPPPARNFTVTGLKPNRRYEFQIVAQNAVGKDESDWAWARTQEAPPSQPLQPIVTPRSSSELQITWSDPAAADFIGGSVVNVTVYSLRPNTDNSYGPALLTVQEATQSPAVVRSIILKRLQPFTVVGVILQVCTRLGCINSTVVNGTTLSAAPEGVYTPDATGSSPTSILVKWRLPQAPNGPSPFYTLSRVLSSFAVPPIQVERGTRFPGAGFVQFSPEILPLSTEFFGVEFLFKTKQDKTLLFLAVSDDEEELVSIQLLNGKPYVLVDPEGCRRSNDAYAIASLGTEFSDTIFTDGNWHRLNFFKDGETMKLTMDETMMSQVTISCAKNMVIGDITSVYVGGVPRNFTIYRNSDSTVQSEETKLVILDNFAGCMRDFAILTAREPSVIWTPLDWLSAIAISLSNELFEGCPLSLSPGIHFLGKGFIVMPSVPEPSMSARIPAPTSFSGGKNFKLELTFRAEFHTGLLYFQFSPKTSHFLFVQLNNSVLEIGILAGTDLEIMNLTMTRLTHLNFCDTSTKTVRIIKTGIKMTYETQDAVARPFSTTADLEADYFYLSSDIYIGGAGPSNSDAIKFIQNGLFRNVITTESFGGCFLAFNIYTSNDGTTLLTPTAASTSPDENGDGEQVAAVGVDAISQTTIVNTIAVLSYLHRYGNISTVLVDGCPPIATTPSRANTCKSPASVRIYQGKDNSYNDTQLSPFSTYLYLSNASNEAGYSLSLWQSGRSLPLPPDVTAVQPPYQVLPLNGRQMLVRWRTPTVYSGMLTAYTITARIDLRVHASVTIQNPGPNDLSATISGLKPFTAYVFYLTVCNSAGCTTSARATRNVTSSEAPEGMGPPVVAERRPWSLYLQWNEPFLRNGDLTGYQLFKDDIRIFAGQMLRFNVTGLRVATANRYAVEACTISGCTRSESVLLMTSSLPPPAPVSPPIATALSATEVRIAWMPVDSSNGVIQMYQVYMALRPNEPLATSIVAVDNETNPTTALIDKLTPGTTYYFRLTACTNGGCTTSDPTSVVTDEAPPDQLLPLNIISADPTRLDVFWEPPLLPNGNLRHYILIHNGRQVLKQLEPRHYAITGLPPWSRNEFQLRACNKEGCTTGNLTVAYSQEDMPQGGLSLDPPIIVDPRTMRIRFWGPEQANGNLTYHILATGPFLIRDPGQGVFKVINDTLTVGTASTWKLPMTIGDFVPASNYTLRVNATNSRGYVISNLQTIQMPKGAPLGFENPVVTVVNSRSLNVRWKPAVWSNGDPVMGSDSAVYMLQWRRVNSPDDVMNAFSFPITGSMYTLHNLTPFKKYEIRVIASNSVAESTYSNWVPVTTPEDCPEGQDVPSVSEITETAVTLQWNPPKMPNGVIVVYGILLNDETMARANLTNTTAGTLFRLTDLEPSTNYQFVIEPCTSVCCTRSNYSKTVKTPSAVPSGLSPPNVAADSPSSVLISWSKPRHPNGVLMWYILERQTKDDDGTITKAVVANISASAKSEDLRFVDRQLLPFTEYDYRILVINDAGSAASEFAHVRTKSARPLGVLPPQSVSPVDPDSVLVSWAPPYRPNGQIEKFVLRVSSPADVSVTVKVDQTKNDQAKQGKVRGRTASSKTPESFQRVVSGLRPYTDYNISVSACSDGGGCSESPPISFRTPPANPEDQPPPEAFATSQHSMFVQWAPPLKPNGPINGYSLDRIKTRQPLLEPAGQTSGNQAAPTPTPPIDDEAWETIYIGNNTYFEDQNLPLFTFYRYRVTAVSNYGRATSLPSAENSTFGEDPLAAPELSASRVTHDSINVSWTHLTVDVLRGAVDRYTVTLQYEKKLSYLLPESAKQTLLTSKDVPGSQHSVVFNDLIPSTAYTVMLTMNMYGGASRRATPIRVATSDGMPSGLRPPSIRSISETQLRLFWFPPIDSNGQIVRYIVYVDDVEVKVLPTSADGSPMNSFATDGDYSTVVGDLLPYHVHSILLSACTRFACGNSTKVFAATVEALPRDLNPPKVVTRGSTWLAIRFMQPDTPNGIITRYDLYRKSTDHCTFSSRICPKTGRRLWKRSLNDVILMDPIDPAEQDAAEMALFQTPKTNKDKQRQTPGCDYISCPFGYRQCGGVCYASNSSLTCCRGELFETRVNYVCCDSNYVPVTDGPLSEKVCCGGRLYKKAEGHQCCYSNYVPIPPGSTCCYNAQQRNVIVSLGDDCCSSLPYRPEEYAQVCFGGILLNRPEQKACGRRLIPASKICCASSSELDAETENADPLSDHKCCGGRYYNTSTAVCCSNGNRAEVIQLDPTRPDLEMTCCGLQLIPAELSCCNGRPYNRKSAICADTASPTDDERKTHFDNCGRGTICPLGASAVCDQCNFPKGEKNCFVEPRENQLNSAFPNDDAKPAEGGNWKGPNYGPIGPFSYSATSAVLSNLCEPRYTRLYSNESVTTFNDTNLKPYTRYEYFIQVTNSIGSVNSSTLMASTTEAPPADLHPPRIVSNPDQLNVLHINWDPPLRPNGAPMFYKLYRDGVLIFSGDTRSFVDTTDVAPFQTYTYWLVACNQISCITSNRVSAATLESVPEGVNLPLVANMNSTCVNLTWHKPDRPNGIITKYILTLREKNPQHKRTVVGKSSNVRDTMVHTAGANIRWLTACNLKPYNQYETSIEACTQVGCRSSEWQAFLTDAALPLEIPEPRVLVVNFLHIDVFWRLPTTPNGPILETVLYRRRDGETFFTRMIAHDFSTTPLAVTLKMKPLNFSDFSVKPGYRYIYMVGFTNPAGRVNSSEVSSYGVPLRAPAIAHRPPTSVTVTGPRDITVVLQDQQPPSNGSIDPSLFDEVIVLFEVETGVEREFFNNGSTANFDLLNPYAIYEARIKTCFKPPETTCSYSDPVFARTKPAPPEGPPLPVATAQSAKSVLITWLPPDKPNGPIDRYEIYRRQTGEEMGLIASIPVVNDDDDKVDLQEDGEENSYTDNDNKLQPFTSYEYRIAAVTTAGRGFSPWATVTTSQARPSAMKPLIVNQTGPYGVEFIWSLPDQTNGPLLHYQIEYRRLNADPSSYVEIPAHVFIVSSNRLSVLISGLKPFSSYSARIIAENSVGAVDSDWITFSTPEAAPTNLLPITVEQAPSGLAVTLRWDEPLSPNGRITRYALYDMTKSESLLWTGSGRVFEYRRLRPFTAYSVILEACTNAGCSKSQPQTFRTAEAPPDLLDPPVVKKVNGHAVKLKWAPPKMPNGDLIEYEVVRIEQPLTGPESNDDEIAEVFKADQRRRRALRLRAASQTTTTVRTTPDLPKQRRSVKTAEDDYLPPQFVAAINSQNDTTSSSKVVYRFMADTLAENNNVFSFVDDDLKPFTRVRYRLRARNNRGLIEIDGPDEVETPESVPSCIRPPRILEADTDELRLKWSFPAEANGLVRSMAIHRQQYDDNHEAVKDSIRKILIQNFYSQELIDSDVKPDTEYAYALEACTSVGCNISRWRHVKTLAPPPDIYSAPTVSAVNATSATVHWIRPTVNKIEVPLSPAITRKPKKPNQLLRSDNDFEANNNGEIVGYRIAINGTELPQLIPANESSCTLTNLQPFHFYSVAVAACVSKPNWDSERDDEEEGEMDDFLRDDSDVAQRVGTRKPEVVVTKRNLLCSAYSRPAAIQTDEALPQNLSAPRAVAISSSAIDVQWREPGEPNGYIVEYVLYRNSSPVAYCDACFSYTDYDLQPATLYVYQLSARNNIGSIKSNETKVRTAISSPEGMPAPNCKSLSSNTVLVTWEKPIKSNGDIVNFTVYINQTDLGYTGLEQHAYVSNLDAYTTYEFSVEACTKVGCVRSTQTRLVTPEAPPQGMDPPTLIALADGTGQHSGVRVSWHPPRFHNGVIKQYTVERRKLSEQRLASGEMQTVVGPPVFVYNGTQQLFLDQALPGSLDAFTLYEYRVTAVNSAGRVSSEWQFGRINTEQAIPDLLKAPVVISVEIDAAVVKILPPERPNGLITEYRLYLNGVVAERRTSPTDVRLENLKPASAFLIHVEACTVVGCTTSPPSGFKTPDAAPSHLKAPIVEVHNLSHVVIKWEMPGQPNGNITSHTVVLSTNCKPPPVEAYNENVEYSGRLRQPLSPLCHPSSRNVAVIKSPDEPLETVVNDLLPYTRYIVVVRMVNSFGYTATSPDEIFSTPPSEPQFLRQPRVVEDCSACSQSVLSLSPSSVGSGKLRISWNDSFSLNSPLQHFTLSINDQTAYEGRALSTTIFAEKDVTKFSMSIAAITDNGIAESPVVEFNLGQIRRSTLGVDGDDMMTSRPLLVAEAATGIFEKPWFVVGIAVIGLFCGAGLIVCACRRCFAEAEKRRRLLAEVEQIAASSPSAVAAVTATSSRTLNKRDDLSCQFSNRGSSAKYVRQRPPLNELPPPPKRHHNHGTTNSTKRNAPKPPCQQSRQQFFSLPHPRATPNVGGASSVGGPLSPVCLSDIGAITRPQAPAPIIEHEAPSPPPSIASLHIEVSGPTATGVAYNAPPAFLALDSESSSILDNCGGGNYVNTNRHHAVATTTEANRLTAVISGDDGASINSEHFFQVWASSTSSATTTKNFQQNNNKADSGLVSSSDDDGNDGFYEIPYR